MFDESEYCIYSISSPNILKKNEVLDMFNLVGVKCYNNYHIIENDYVYAVSFAIVTLTSQKNRFSTSRYRELLKHLKNEFLFASNLQQLDKKYTAQSYIKTKRIHPLIKN